MRKLEPRFSMLVFAACYAVLLVAIPWIHEWMSQLGLLFPPYGYMLNVDFYSLSCRAPGVLVWVVLALSFYSINMRVCKAISARVSEILFRVFFFCFLFIFFALALTVMHFQMLPFIFDVYLHFDVTSVCARQSFFYWDMWIYSGLIYLFSAIVSGVTSALRSRVRLPL